VKHLALQAALSEIRRSLNGSEQIDADDLAGHLGRPSAGQELVSADRSDGNDSLQWPHRDSFIWPHLRYR